MSDTEKVECDRCANETEADETVSIGNGDTVCESCSDDFYVGCGYCAETVDVDDTDEISGDTVCTDCRDNNFSWCEGCDEYVDMHRMISVDYYTSRCEDCVNDGWHYCESCDVYYADGDWCEGEACQDCDCESPAQSFHVRNDGHGPLANDTRTSVSLPAGEISAEGIAAISRLIMNHGSSLPAPASTYAPDGGISDEYREWRDLRNQWFRLSHSIENIGTTWQGKDGNYTKRLSRYAYKNFGLKVPPAIVSEVGNIGRAHSDGRDVAIEVTRRLNMPAYDFGHEDSCFWQSYFASRCTLKSNGGYGLRSFGELKDYYGNAYGEGVTGRVWVFPLKLVDGGLTNTFESENPDAFVVFNGYGDLSGYTGARIVAHMAGMTYRKVNFYADPIYVNSEAGYLVAPEEIAKDYTDGTLTLDTSDHSNLYNREVSAGTVCDHFAVCSCAA